MGKGSTRRNENAQAVRGNWPFPDRPRVRYVPPEEQRPAQGPVCACLDETPCGWCRYHGAGPLDTSVTPD